MTKVYEVNPLVYHYTTTEGLKGIIESQQIHATSIAYLNDQEEHTGYFVHRLPALLKQRYYNAYLVWRQGHPPAKRPSEEELLDAATKEAKDMSDKMWAATETLHDPYVASFSAPRDLDLKDGLLSQWRG